MSIEVCGPNEAMVKTGACVSGGRQIIVGGCTCFCPCLQELHRMELAVMTVVVHSVNVVTAEGVEITAEGLTQVRIDPGMADDQADAMIVARNEDLEHKVEEVIRQKTLFNKSTQELEPVKGVPGVTWVKVVTVAGPEDKDRDGQPDSSGRDLSCDVAREVTMGKKRLAAFVGPPGKKVTEAVFAECHRKLKGSGMVPYWIKAMPQHASDASYDVELEKVLAHHGWTVQHGNKQKFVDDNQLAIKACEAAYGKLTDKDHPTRQQIYKSTGYWPGSQGPIRLLLTEIDGDLQTFLGPDGKNFHPQEEPSESTTIADLKKLLCTSVFYSPQGKAVRGKICDLHPDEMDIVYMGKGDGDYGELIDKVTLDDSSVTVIGKHTERVDDVQLTLFAGFVGFTKPSREAQHILRVQQAVKLADTRVGPSRQDTREDFDLQGAGGDHPFWVSDDKTMFVFAAKDEDEQTAWVEKIQDAIDKAQNLRRETATVRDAKRGSTLLDTRTLADYKLSHGDCLVIKRKVGVSVSKSFEPEPEPAPYEASPSEFDGLIARADGSDEATEKVSDAQHQEEIADSEAHEGDEDFKDKVTRKAQSNLDKAAAQFVSKERHEIIDMVRETLEGHQRAIMAELTVDEIYKDRLMFQRKVRETADVDLAKMGLRVISYTLKDVSDANGYMNSLGVRRIEEVKKEARMGEAMEQSQADQRCALYDAETVQTQKVCETEIANSQKNFVMRQQEWKNQVQEATQEAQMATALEMQVQQKKLAELKGAVDATRVEWQTKIDALEKERVKLNLDATENLHAQFSKDKSNMIAEAAAKAKVAVAEAEALRQTRVAAAQADVITKKGEASAEVMEAKADAWLAYGEKSYVDMVSRTTIAGIWFAFFRKCQH